LEQILTVIRVNDHLLRLAILAVVSGAIAGCGIPTQPEQQKGNNMALPDEMFEKIQVGMLGPTPCSPQKQDLSFRGILINAPKQVLFKKGQRIGRLGAFVLIPVCGYYHLNVPSPPKYSNIIEAMTLVAINIETKQRYAGPMIDPDTAAPPPRREPPPREMVANISVEGYFNPNLANYVSLPQEPGTYAIHVELENIKSNIVQVKLVESK
jgi:hypothetical protein